MNDITATQVSSDNLSQTSSCPNFCHGCSPPLLLLKSIASDTTLPIGVPATLMEGEGLLRNVYVKIQVSHNAVRCLCGYLDANHIHCIHCWAQIIGQQTGRETDEEMTRRDSLSELAAWGAVVNEIRSCLPIPTHLDDESLRFVLPCRYFQIWKDVTLSPDPKIALEQALAKRSSSLAPCSHRSTIASHSQLLPRSSVKFYVHDIGAGSLGHRFEQVTGPAILCRNRPTPITVKDQPNFIHILATANYNSSTKGYDQEDEDVPRPTTPRAQFHAAYGEKAQCHGVCHGDQDISRYASCRMIESAFMLWLMHIGALDKPSCGKCDMDILALVISVAVDTPDRVRDGLTGEIFNINSATGRQNQLAMAVWRNFVVKRVKGTCCGRVEDLCRAVSNLFVWAICNPVYYAYRAARDDGVVELVEALNMYLWGGLEGEHGEWDGGDPAKVDEVIDRLVSTGLLDFLVCYSA